MEQFDNAGWVRRAACLGQSGLVAIAATAITLGSTLTSPTPAAAQAAYGSYIGAGAGFGVTEGGAGEPQETSAVIALRYRFLRAPISFRTQAFIGDGVAVVPTLSYDFPLTWQATAYIGAGAAIPVTRDNTTPVGNQTSFAIQPGIDYALPNSEIVLYGNAVIAFDAYEIGGGTAASLQVGAGLRF
jgi:hypothetical protein